MKVNKFDALMDVFRTESCKGERKTKESCVYQIYVCMYVIIICRLTARTQNPVERGFPFTTHTKFPSRHIGFIIINVVMDIISKRIYSNQSRSLT